MGIPSTKSCRCEAPLNHLVLRAVNPFDILAGSFYLLDASKIADCTGKIFLLSDRFLWFHLEASWRIKDQSDANGQEMMCAS